MNWLRVSENVLILSAFCFSYFQIPSFSGEFYSIFIQVYTKQITLCDLRDFSPVVTVTNSLPKHTSFSDSISFARNIFLMHQIKLYFNIIQHVFECVCCVWIGFNFYLFKKNLIAKLNAVCFNFILYMAQLFQVLF